jgi:hypothetical protein
MRRIVSILVAAGVVMVHGVAFNIGCSGNSAAAGTSPSSTSVVDAVRGTPDDETTHQVSLVQGQLSAAEIADIEGIDWSTETGEQFLSDPAVAHVVQILVSDNLLAMRRRNVVELGMAHADSCSQQEADAAAAGAKAVAGLIINAETTGTVATAYCSSLGPFALACGVAAVVYVSRTIVANAVTSAEALSQCLNNPDGGAADAASDVFSSQPGYAGVGP